jgi:peptide/nickel transport system ATP-binding protein
MDLNRPGKKRSYVMMQDFGYICVFSRKQKIIYPGPICQQAKGLFIRNSESIEMTADTSIPANGARISGRVVSVLDVRNLTVVFSGNDEPDVVAVNQLSFELFPGETLGIVGESGSGKSVTAMSLLRLVESPGGRIAEGEIILHDSEGNSTDLLKLSDRQMRAVRGKEIAMIFQDPMTSLNPVITCGKQVTESIIQHLRIPKKDARQSALNWFREVDLPRVEEIYNSYPYQLSGGQRQRVMIAMAMSGNPKILIADEPTTALDVTVQKTILELMKKLQQRYGMSMIFITHDLALIRNFAGRILVMYKGSIVENEEAELLFRSPKHPYTRGLLNCRPSGTPRLKRLPTIDDYLIPGRKTNQDIETREERMQRHERMYALKPVLQVREIETEFRGGARFLTGKGKRIVKAVDRVSFSVYPGETLGIVGESGCGKTTLGRTILQLVKSSAGEIMFEGKNLNGLSGKELRAIRKDLQIIFQDPYSALNPRIRAGEAIMEPMRVLKILNTQAEREKRTVDLLLKVGLDAAFMHRYPHELSGGQRQRICIARALGVNPKLIICDESVSSLDASVQAQVLNLLNDLKREFGFTYLFISHDLSVVQFMADRIIVMKGGQIEEIGESDQICSSPRSSYTKTLIDAIPEI